MPEGKRLDAKFFPEPRQPEQTQSSLTYGKLRQQNPDYDADRMQELHDLHAGGYAIAKRVDKYLPALCNEHPKRCEERRWGCAYLNYFGQVVEQFTSDLFAQPLTVQPAPDAKNPNTPGKLPDEDFYNAFQSDCDLDGTPFVDLMKDALTYALVQRCGFVCLDAADPDTVSVDPDSKADEEAQGLGRIYAYGVSPRNVIDWRVGKGKKDLEWAIVQERTQERDDPDALRDQVTETFTVWRMAGSVAAFERHTFQYDPKTPPKDEDRPTKSTPLKPTSFKRLPLIRMVLPKGLWVGAKAGPPQKEHWQRRSALVAAEGRSMVAVPFVKRGPEIGAVGGEMPSETQENPNRGRDPVGTSRRAGFVELGADDDIGFAEPHGHAYAIVNKELDELKDEIFRVVHQMAASVRPSAGSLGRSAASKQEDGKATALVLRALGHEVRQFAVRVYKTVAEARGDDVVWTPNGLDNYEAIDRQSILEEAVSLPQVCESIPSQTFRTLYSQQLAEKLLTGVDPQTIGTMKDEIEEGVAGQHELNEMKLDAAKDEIENPTPPVVVAPGAKPPAPKSPQAPNPSKKQAA